MGRLRLAVYLPVFAWPQRRPALEAGRREQIDVFHPLDRLSGSFELHFSSMSIPHWMLQIVLNRMMI